MKCLMWYLAQGLAYRRYSVNLRWSFPPQQRSDPLFVVHYISVPKAQDSSAAIQAQSVSSIRCGPLYLAPLGIRS